MYQKPPELAFAFFVHSSDLLPVQVSHPLETTISFGGHATPIHASEKRTKNVKSTPQKNPANKLRKKHEKL
jgi:hypothetical protein